MSVDIRKRLAKANDLEMPELWPEVRSRLRSGPVPSRASSAGGRQRFVAAFAALAVFTVAGAFAWTALRPASNSGSVGSSGAQAPPDWLIQVARRMAADNDDPTPTSARWVLTDSRTAAPAVGLSPDQGSGAAEYLVVLEGKFTALGAKTPQGTPLPKGTTLVVTLDPSTHQVNDFGVTNQTIDIPGLASFQLATANPTLGGLTLLESATGPSGDQALLKGELGSQGGCLTVGGASGVFVVWPSGYGLTGQGGETWVTDDSGRLVAKIGDTIEMGGGVTNLKDIQSSVPAGIPASCQVQGADHYWFAGTPSLVTGASGAAARAAQAAARAAASMGTTASPVLQLSCAGGKTRVLTPLVQAQSDGLHVQVVSGSGDANYVDVWSPTTKPQMGWRVGAAVSMPSS